MFRGEYRIPRIPNRRLGIRQSCTTCLKRPSIAHLLPSRMGKMRRIQVLRGSDMNAGAHTDGGLSAVPLLNAVFCADCETISDSPHDACTVCGSRSLVNLC